MHDSDPFLLVPRAAQNSRVVREPDPRASRHLWLLLLLVAALVAGLAAYGWPRLQAQRLDERAAHLQRERERLLEQNRKLRLEKATLENLSRVRTIATRDLGFITPPVDQVFVAVKPAPAASDATRLVSAPEHSDSVRAD